jgi:hypothetical protein
MNVIIKHDIGNDTNIDIDTSTQKIILKITQFNVIITVGIVLMSNTDTFTCPTRDTPNSRSVHAI